MKELIFADLEPHWTLDPAQPITPQVHRILRERVIRGDLPAGQQISETEIANRYAISRQPVREAFIKLAEEGLMAVRPQRGTIVTKIAYNAVLDARFVREAVEGDIVRLLANAPDAVLIKELRQQIERQKDVASSKPDAFINLDEIFHRTLADGAGRSGTWGVIQGLKAQMDRVRFLALAQFPLARLLSQHVAIVDRIEAADMVGADAAVRNHLREILRDLPEILQNYPDLFDLPGGDTPEPANVPIQGGDQYEAA
ncbi:MAG: GntR family transcriptional regulator [Pseudomonadota bacterium]